MPQPIRGSFSRRPSGWLAFLAERPTHMGARRIQTDAAIRLRHRRPETRRRLIPRDQRGACAPSGADVVVPSAGSPVSQHVKVEQWRMLLGAVDVAVTGTTGRYRTLERKLHCVGEWEVLES